MISAALFWHLSCTLPFAALLDDIFTDLLGVEAEGTELGGESGGGAGFTAENFDVDCVGREVLYHTSVGSTLGGILW